MCFRLFFSIAVLAICSGHATRAQVAEYVCMPCGSDCDKKVHSTPGACSSCGMALVEKASVVFTNISVAELCARVQANPKAILLDVRSPGEFTGSAIRNSYGHFRNAININIDELESRLNELSKYKNDEVIVYCSHSRRSPRASHILTTHGFKNVRNMQGGVSTLSKMSDACLSKLFVVH